MRSLIAIILVALGLAGGAGFYISGFAPPAEIGRTEAALAPPGDEAADAGPARAAPRLEILRRPGDITVIGLSPGAGTSRALDEALRAEAPADTVTDLSLTARGGDPADDWRDPAETAARLAAGLRQGRVVMEAGRIAVMGLVDGEAEQTAMEATALSALTDAWTIERDVTPAPAPGAASSLLASIGGEAPMRLIACVAPDEAVAARVEARAAALGVARPACRADGDQTVGWGDAALAALEALAALPAGKMSLTGERARLTASAPTSQPDLAAAAATLREILPEGYRLAVVAAPELGDGERADTVGDEPALLSLAFTYDGSVMTLAGAAPDDVLADSIVAVARAQLAGATVANDLDLAPDAASPNWGREATALIAALARLERGAARVADGEAMLEGVAADPLAISAIDAALREALNEVPVVETRLTVSPGPIAAAQPLPLQRCAEELTRIAAANPILFAPGSSEIEESSRPTVARLAGVVARCAGGRIEIGGHTDSQGLESTNLALSRERADAVQAALADAGASLARLSAAGFGEARPVADNATEAGRARNRRIEFRALGAAAEDDPAEEEGADAPPDAPAEEDGNG